LTPERWKRISALFESAVELPPAEREAYLAEECGGDDELRRRVLSLIAAEESPSPILERPALSLDHETREEEPPRLLLGRYRIGRRLGRGGMGDVYLAEDTRLGRTVAVKLLRADLTSDRERVRRFRQEAKTVLKLDHPSVVHLYEVESENGHHFMVTEYVRGVTLRERLREGPLALQEAVRVALEVLKAVGAAHAEGIVHRDLKPENVMLRPDGYVKVLDFGIAKLLPRAGGGQGNNDSFVRTETGVVIGTVKYMSPEQARGLEVDARTDLWSAGVLLYETATARLPFEGETNSDLLVSILGQDPAPVERHLPAAPAGLGKILNRALAKRREERYPSAAEMAADLEELLRSLGSGEWAAASAGDRWRHAPTARMHVGTSGSTSPAATEAGTAAREGAHDTISISRRGAQLAAFVAALVLFVGASLLAYRYIFKGGAGTAQDDPFQHMQVQRLTSTGHVTDAAISPDGKLVAYVEDRQGRESLYVKQVATGTVIRINQPSEEVKLGDLTFAPGGDYVYYTAAPRGSNRASIYYVATLGGAPVLWREHVLGGALAFSPDGRRIVFGDSTPDMSEIRLLVADVAGGEPRVVASRHSPEFYYGAIWSPDGESLTSGVQSRGETGFYSTVVSIDLKTGRETPLTARRFARAIPLAWTADGRSVLLTGGERPGVSQIWQLTPASDELRRVTNDLSNYSKLSLTKDGGSLVSVQYEEVAALCLGTLEGHVYKTRPLTKGRSDGSLGVDWTPDGRIVYAAAQGNQIGLVVTDVEGSEPQPVVTGAEAALSPSVSPDGRFIAYESGGASARLIQRVNAQGGGRVQLTSSKVDSTPRYTPDGRWVLYTSWARGRATAMKVPSGGGEPSPVVDKMSAAPVASPDGKWIAYFTAGERGMGVGVVPAEGAGEEKFVPLAGHPDTLLDFPLLAWHPDGRSLVYSETRGDVSNLWRQPLDGGQPTPITELEADRIFYFAFSRDGRRVALSRGNVTSDVVLFSNLGR
jgi:Tol biopolymer transport system component